MAVPRLGGSCHAPRTRSEPNAELPATRSGRRAKNGCDTVAIPLMSEFAPTPAALIDGDQMLIVELSEGDPELVALVREAEDSEVEGGMVAAGQIGRASCRERVYVLV